MYFQFVTGYILLTGMLLTVSVWVLVLYYCDPPLLRAKLETYPRVPHELLVDASQQRSVLHAGCLDRGHTQRTHVLLFAWGVLPADPSH